MTDPWGDLINSEIVTLLHEEAIDRYGGGEKVPPRDGCVEGSLGSAWSAELYREEEGSSPGLIFASYVLFYLVNNHCFGNGNKRVAWMASQRVLLQRGLTVDATNREAEEFVESIARNDINSPDDVVHWIAARLVAARLDL